MLDRLLALLDQSPSATRDTVGTPFPRWQLAVVALFVELAQSDRQLVPEELSTIERIVRDRFGLDTATAARLIAAARRELDAALEDWVFATAVRNAFDATERIEIVELLWEIVYADGGLVRLEESLMRRLSAQLGIGEAEREAARAQAFARTGLARGSEPQATEPE
ncbi:MAG TPA: TerB family tellurite resistance protein [Casimicrobiaceae bacterium]